MSKRSRKRQAHGTRTSAPVDPTRINRKCQNSYGIPTHYHSFDAVCKGCGIDFHVSAEELKHIHEDLKVIIWAPVDRCPKCQGEWNRIKLQAHQLMQQSLRGRPTEQIRQALQCYERYVKLGGRRSRAFENAIRQVLQEPPASGPVTP